MICAADAAGEKSVTCKDHLVSLVVETHATRSMSGSGNHLKLSIAELDNLPILQRQRGEGRVRLLQAENLAEIMLKDIIVLLVHVDRNAIFVSTLLHPENMVEMAVRQQHHDRTHLLLGNLPEQGLRLRIIVKTRVNDDAFACFIPSQ